MSTSTLSPGLCASRSSEKMFDLFWLDVFANFELALSSLSFSRQLEYESQKPEQPKKIRNKTVQNQVAIRNFFVKIVLE